MSLDMKRLVQAALDSVKAEEARGGNLTPQTAEAIVRAVLHELDMVMSHRDPTNMEEAQTIRYTRIGVRNILYGANHG